MHDTMLHCKRKITHRTILRNLIHLSSVLHNAIRYSSKFQMQKRFNEICGKLLLVDNAEEAIIVIDRSTAFKRSGVKFGNMLF